MSSSALQELIRARASTEVPHGQEMSVEDLWDLLDAGRVDHDELRAILFDHFASEGLTSESEVFLGEPGRPALRLSYDNRRRLAAINRGPSLTERDVSALRDAIAENLLGEPVRVISRSIFSSPVPVTGRWSQGRTLQILPPPPEAPAIAHGVYPYVIEYEHATAVHWQLREMRRNRRLQEIALLIAGLVEQSSSPIARIVGGYRIEGFEHDATDFTASSVGPLATIEPELYYTRRGLAIDAVMEIPSNLAQSLSRYEVSSHEERDSFRRAAYWLRFASQVGGLSRSAAYIALINSIESLMPSTEQRHVTRRFVRFIEEYAPFPQGEQDEARKELCAVRSDVAHGRTLLGTDLEQWQFATIDPRLSRELALFDGARQIAQLTLVN